MAINAPVAAPDGLSSRTPPDDPPDEQKAAVAALCGKESEVLLAPNVSASPPAFPALPLGMECFIDEAAATAALTKVPGLQKKQCARVCRRGAAPPSHPPLHTAAPQTAAPPSQPPLHTAPFHSPFSAPPSDSAVPSAFLRRYALVPKKLDERAFWTNFFTHMTALVAPAAGGSA